ncbi:hypothetical protein [Kitasatospora sp. NPDC088351]|uniref:hypothetical protein n=1 Tax=Kitasatospora sp. NPDC088351 TaxID=3155180 RepID=UPI003431B53C
MAAVRKTQFSREYTVDASPPRPKPGRVAIAPKSWVPLDDYLNARRPSAFDSTAEVLSKAAVLAHCECVNCTVGRSA